jgi:hypothetical protein
MVLPAAQREEEDHLCAELLRGASVVARAGAPLPSPAAAPRSCYWADWWKTSVRFSSLPSFAPTQSESNRLPKCDRPV